MSETTDLIDTVRERLVYLEAQRNPPSREELDSMRLERDKAIAAQQVIQQAFDQQRLAQERLEGGINPNPGTLTAADRELIELENAKKARDA